MSNQARPKKLKRVVIKEELVALTGDHIKALILNQFIFWSERTRDFDQFINEERQRDENIKVDLTSGWVYKTAEDLSDELMIGLAPNSIRRHLKKLIDTEYLHQRNNPRLHWDRTLQYRPNMIKIQTDLKSLGYALEGYPLVIATSKLEDGKSNLDVQTSQNGGAIPKTTAKTTTESLANSQNSQTNGNAPSSPDHRMAEKVEGLANAISKTAGNDNPLFVKGATELALVICSICGLDIMTIVNRKTQEALINITIALYMHKVSKADLTKFGSWWYDNTWQGKKRQPPTPEAIGDSWGQFEAQKVAPPSNGPTLTDAQKKRLEELIAENG